MERGKESFSDVIPRLAEERKRKSLEIFEKYAGSLEDSNLFEVVIKERKFFKILRTIDVSKIKFSHLERYKDFTINLKKKIG